MSCFISTCIIFKINHILYIIKLIKSKNIFFTLLEIGFSEENEIKRLLKELPFYNVSIEKPKMKKLNNVEILRQLPFYDELNKAKSVAAFKDYARCYSIEIITDKDGNMNDPLV